MHVGLLRWGERLEAGEAKVPRLYDLILCADCVQHRASHAALVKCLLHFVRPDTGRVLMVAPARDGDLYRVHALMRATFHVGEHHDAALARLMQQQAAGRLAAPTINVLRPLGDQKDEPVSEAQQFTRALESAMAARLTATTTPAKPASGYLAEYADVVRERVEDASKMVRRKKILPPSDFGWPSPRAKPSPRPLTRAGERSLIDRLAAPRPTTRALPAVKRKGPARSKVRPKRRRRQPQ